MPSAATIDNTGAFLAGFAEASPAGRPVPPYKHRFVDLAPAYRRLLGDAVAPKPPPDSPEEPYYLLGTGAGQARAATFGGTQAAELAPARAALEHVAARGFHEGLTGNAAMLLALVGDLQRGAYGQTIRERIDEALNDPAFYAKMAPLHEAPLSREASDQLAVVLRDPDDASCTRERDTEARLAFAQAIQGDDPIRAGFIRLQIRNETEVQIARDIILLHGRRWSPVLDLVDSYDFRRGFVAQASLGAPDFLRRAADLYARAPITQLVLRDVKAAAAELVASPHLERIRVLVASGQHLGDDFAHAVAGSPHLANLVWLDLTDNDLSVDGVLTLAESKLLPRLRIVNLGGNPGDPVRVEVPDALGGAVDFVIPDAWAHLQEERARLAWETPLRPRDAVYFDPW